MAKKQTKKKKSKDLELDGYEREGRTASLQESTVRIIYSILLFIVSLFLIFSAFNAAGPVGVNTFGILSNLLGLGYYLLPVILIVLGALFVKSLKQHAVAWPKLVGSFLFLLASLGVLSTVMKDSPSIESGGMVGSLISNPLVNLFDFWVTLIFLVGVMVISAILVFETHVTWSSLAFWRKEESELSDEEEAIEEKKPEPVMLREEEKDIPVPDDRNQEKKPEKKEKKELGFSISSIRIGKPYVPPPLELLKRDSGKPGVGDIKANANIIKRTLQNFGINVEMDEISIGPSVTRYALKPAEGVKLARIVGLQNDLSLALAAHPLRI
ncbi:MAG: ftsK [Candidatus Paceibacter sp.]|nr:ftsK [Candidatus Paceibacter sp.]